MPQQIAMQRIYGISEKEAKEWVEMIAVEQGLSDPAEFENEHDAKLFGGME